MSEQSTKAFLERMKTDEGFRDEVMAEPEPEARLALIRAGGYDCSLDEIAGLGGALAEADLGAVAGGLWDVCSATTWAPTAPPTAVGDSRPQLTLVRPLLGFCGALLPVLSRPLVPR